MNTINEWGEAILTGGVKPLWLRSNDVLQWRTEYGSYLPIWYGQQIGVEYDSWNAWDSEDWEVIYQIRLPANHPYYLATSKRYTYWAGDVNPPENVSEDLMRYGKPFIIDNDSGFLRWHHINSGGDVIGYKVKEDVVDDIVVDDIAVDDIAEWAFKEAINRVNAEDTFGDDWEYPVDKGHPAVRALAKTIENTEEAPVDPDVAALERVIEAYGYVVGSHSVLWGKALTQFKAEIAAAKERG